MPREIISIAETYHSITRPVAISVIKDMLQHLGLNKDTAIVFPGYADQVPYNKTTTDDLGPQTPVNIATRQYAYITVTEQYADHTARSESPDQLDAYPIFYDAATETKVTPVYNTKLMEISIMLRASDATIARKWLAQLKNMITRDYQTGAHLVNYSYVIPEAVMVVIMEIHRLRELNAPYNISLGKYVGACFTKNFIIDTNQAGKVNTPLIREAQTQVHAWFELDQTNPNEPQKNNNTGEWELELNYKFYYSKVEKLVVEYPIVVHNNQINTKLINLANLPAFEQNYLQETTDARLPLGHFIGHRDYGSQNKINPGLPIPWYDDWKIPKSTTNAKTEACFLRVLTLVEVGNKLLLNLEDMGDYTFSTSLIRHFKRRPTSLTKYHDNIYTVRVYRGDNLLDMNKAHVTPTLDVIHDYDYDQREVYRVVMTIVTDPSILSDDALRDLSKDECLLADYFYMITGTYKYYPKPKNCPLLTDSDVDLDKIRDVIKEINKDRGLISPPPYARMLTVGNYTIISRRK